MRSYNYNLKRLKEDEIAGPKTANALIDFCLGMSSTSRYLMLNPNGHGSVSFDLDEGGLMAEILSHVQTASGDYTGPFAMSSTGVSAGRCLLFGNGGNQFIDFPAVQYSNMYNSQGVTAGIVWADIAYNSSPFGPSGWQPFYFILPASSDPVFGQDEYFWPIGAVDISQGTFVQWHFGDQLITLSGGGEYNGPWKLVVSGSQIMITGSTAIYAGTATIPLSTSSVTYTSGTVYVILTIGLNAAGTGLVANVAGSNSPQLTQTDTQYQVCLGMYDGTKMTQWQYGDIYIAGRAV